MELSKKDYIKKDTVLVAGDFIAERCRFKPNEFGIFVITRIYPERDEMYIKKVFSSRPQDKPPFRELYSNISAHSIQHNTSYLSYKLPLDHPMVLLYGRD